MKSQNAHKNMPKLFYINIPKTISKSPVNIINNKYVLNSPRHNSGHITTFNKAHILHINKPKHTGNLKVQYIKPEKINVSPNNYNYNIIQNYIKYIPYINKNNERILNKGIYPNMRKVNPLLKNGKLDMNNNMQFNNNKENKYNNNYTNQINKINLDKYQKKYLTYINGVNNNLIEKNKNKINLAPDKLNDELDKNNYINNKLKKNENANNKSSNNNMPAKVDLNSINLNNNQNDDSDIMNNNFSLAQIKSFETEYKNGSEMRNTVQNFMANKTMMIKNEENKIKPLQEMDTLSQFISKETIMSVYKDDINKIKIKKNKSAFPKEAFSNVQNKNEEQGIVSQL